jgi:hypothetical protein
LCHAGLALGADPGSGVISGGLAGVWFGLIRQGLAPEVRNFLVAEEGLGLLQTATGPGGGIEAKVPDLGELRRQDVEEKAP